LSADLLAAALDYARDGRPVFPCEPSGERPLLDGGAASATLDAEQIRKWWAESPNANIGIVTGAASGVVALLVGDGGVGSLGEWERRHDRLPDTCSVRTGRGEWQLCFRYPGVPVRCGPGVLGPGLSLCGDGDFVVAPPSVDAGGQRYTFPGSRELADLPAWLAQRATKGKAAPNSTRAPEPPAAPAVSPPSAPAN
jgi:putative DNA primase/helicase